MKYGSPWELQAISYRSTVIQPRISPNKIYIAAGQKDAIEYNREPNLPERHRKETRMDEVAIIADGRIKARPPVKTDDVVTLGYVQKESYPIWKRDGV